MDLSDDQHPAHPDREDAPIVLEVGEGKRFGSVREAYLAAEENTIIEVHGTPPDGPELVLEIAKCVHLRGVGRDYSRLQVATLLVTCFGEMHIENMTIEGDPNGYMESLIQASNISGLALNTVTICGGGNGLLVTKSTKVTMCECYILDNSGHGIVVDEGRVTLNDCQVIGNAMNGIVASAVKPGQGDSCVQVTNSTVTQNGMAGVAAIYGGWIFLHSGCEVWGHTSGAGVYVAGGRSICHIRDDAKVYANDVGVLLMQRALAHAAPGTVPGIDSNAAPPKGVYPQSSEEQEDFPANTTMLVKYPYCDLVHDGGEASEEAEREWSNTSRNNWETKGRKSIVDMRNQTCGVNANSGPGGDCMLS